LIKAKNFGKKSLQEIKEKLEKFNLSFGMSESDIKQYIENN
jgi:DNA-directed RNA polymerase alpha subunit